MAKITVNKSSSDYETQIVEGTFCFTRVAKQNENDEWYEEISGVFATYDYIDCIKSLESDRYMLDDIFVFKETFDVDGFSIVYNFIAKKCEIFPSPLTKREKESIEAKLYKERRENYGFDLSKD